MLTLSIPQRRDPIARGVLLALVGAVTWLMIARPGVEPVQASSAPDIIILDQATATPALPTPPSDAPALGLAVATPEQPIAALPPVLRNQPDQPWLPAEPLAPLPAADNSQYLANVGEQAPHSPRGNVSEPPPYQAGPVAQPVGDDGVLIVLDPNPAPAQALAPAMPAIAVAVPPISQAQAAILAERDSNGCAPGQVFVPRSGCHTPGSGGAMPGAVGEP